MTYQVLARKYRPRSFDTFVGQEAVVKTLTQAFSQGRLHQAYLLTGTRGVGKTTLGRIIARCFNCETGVTASPCGICNPCQDIEANRALDVIEIDAASNTKVEDTRELLANVQYAPSRDRFKIYLIDEVHMLSGHSFNALLKTLEEPPAHVKFILATTDPQKLPATILSRCLQFHLKPIAPSVMVQQLNWVCGQEKVQASEKALNHLAAAAQGSLRDALSLLDQAIAYGNGRLTEEDVQALLGMVKEADLEALMEALAKGDGLSALQQLDRCFSEGGDGEALLNAMLSFLQKVSVAQCVPEAIHPTDPASELFQKFAQRFNRETIQLLYQIGLIGKRDLPWAPSARAGLEMMVLRMLYFVPVQTTVPTAVPVKIVEKKPAEPVRETVKEGVKPVKVPTWSDWIPQLGLSGLTLAIAQHCALIKQSDDQIELQIDPAHALLANEAQKQLLQEKISTYLNRPIRLVFQVGKVEGSPEQEKNQQMQAEKIALQKRLEADPHLQDLQRQFSAKIKNTY